MLNASSQSKETQSAQSQSKHYEDFFEKAEQTFLVNSNFSKDQVEQIRNCNKDKIPQLKDDMHNLEKISNYMEKKFKDMKFELMREYYKEALSASDNLAELKEARHEKIHDLMPGLDISEYWKEKKDELNAKLRLASSRLDYEQELDEHNQNKIDQYDNHSELNDYLGETKDKMSFDQGAGLKNAVSFVKQVQSDYKSHYGDENSKFTGNEQEILRKLVKMVNDRKLGKFRQTDEQELERIKKEKKGLAQALFSQTRSISMTDYKNKLKGITSKINTKNEKSQSSNKKIYANVKSNTKVNKHVQSNTKINEHVQSNTKVNEDGQNKQKFWKRQPTNNHIPTPNNKSRTPNINIRTPNNSKQNPNNSKQNSNNSKQTPNNKNRISNSAREIEHCDERSGFNSIDTEESNKFLQQTPDEGITKYKKQFNNNIFVNKLDVSKVPRVKSSPKNQSPKRNTDDKNKKSKAVDKQTKKDIKLRNVYHTLIKDSDMPLENESKKELFDFIYSNKLSKPSNGSLEKFQVQSKNLENQFDNNVKEINSIDSVKKLQVELKEYREKLEGLLEEKQKEKSQSPSNSIKSSPKQSKKKILDYIKESSPKSNKKYGKDSVQNSEGSLQDKIQAVGFFINSIDKNLEKHDNANLKTIQSSDVISENKKNETVTSLNVSKEYIYDSKGNAFRRRKTEYSVHKDCIVQTDPAHDLFQVTLQNSSNGCVNLVKKLTAKLMHDNNYNFGTLILQNVIGLIINGSDEQKKSPLIALLDNLVNNDIENNCTDLSETIWEKLIEEVINITNEDKKVHCLEILTKKLENLINNSQVNKSEKKLDPKVIAYEYHNTHDIIKLKKQEMENNKSNPSYKLSKWLTSKPYSYREFHDNIPTSLINNTQISDSYFAPIKEEENSQKSDNSENNQSEPKDQDSDDQLDNLTANFEMKTNFGVTPTKEGNSNIQLDSNLYAMDIIDIKDGESIIKTEKDISSANKESFNYKIMKTERLENCESSKSDNSNINYNNENMDNIFCDAQEQNSKKSNENKIYQTENIFYNDLGEYKTSDIMKSDTMLQNTKDETNLDKNIKHKPSKWAVNVFVKDILEDFAKFDQMFELKEGYFGFFSTPDIKKLMKYVIFETQKIKDIAQIFDMFLSKGSYILSKKENTNSEFQKELESALDLLRKIEDKQSLRFHRAEKLPEEMNKNFRLDLQNKYSNIIHEIQENTDRISKEVHDKEEDIFKSAESNGSINDKDSYQQKKEKYLKDMHKIFTSNKLSVPTYNVGNQITYNNNQIYFVEDSTTFKNPQHYPKRESAYNPSTSKKPKIYQRMFSNRKKSTTEPKSDTEIFCRGHLKSGMSRGDMKSGKNIDQNDLKLYDIPLNDVLKDGLKNFNKRHRNFSFDVSEQKMEKLRDKCNINSSFNNSEAKINTEKVKDLLKNKFKTQNNFYLNMDNVRDTNQVSFISKVKASLPSSNMNTTFQNTRANDNKIGSATERAPRGNKFCKNVFTDSDNTIISKQGLPKLKDHEITSWKKRFGKYLEENKASDQNNVFNTERQNLHVSEYENSSNFNSFRDMKDDESLSIK